MNVKALIVDDDVFFSQVLDRVMKAEGLETNVVHSAEDALATLPDAQPEIAFVDVGLPGMDGIALVEQLVKRDSGLVCIMVSAQTTFQTAVDAMRAGAFDFIGKDARPPEIQLRLRRGLEMVRMRRHLEYLQASVPVEIIGHSSSMRRLDQQITEVAATPSSTVLIHGETGTGKELVAKAIHKRSARSDKPFISVNCAAVPEQLLESEFFGHERGAFTGADRARKGLVELADRGTFFLDEIGEMDLRMQVKLLRLIEERRFRRVGGASDLAVDVRFVAATNKDLAALAAAGTFREDLLYRLNVYQIALPALRERGEDVLELAQHFIGIYNREFKKCVAGIDAEAGSTLRGHPFPGNVRQLRNFIEQAMIRARGETLTLEHFPGLLPISSLDRAIAPEPRQAGPRLAPAGGETIWAGVERAKREAERETVERALASAGGNKSRAAELLGISRYALQRRLRSLGLDRR
jgi:two-component system, NtrC family, response regulator AtoC